MKCYITLKWSLFKNALQSSSYKSIDIDDLLIGLNISSTINIIIHILLKEEMDRRNWILRNLDNVAIEERGARSSTRDTVCAYGLIKNAIGGGSSRSGSRCGRQDNK